MEPAVSQFREGNPDVRLRASELLERYPQLDENELSELHHFYRASPAIDTALMTCDPLLRPKISQFLSEQRSHLRVISRTTTLWVVFIGILATMIAIGLGI